jgi:hypothetical protein
MNLTVNISTRGRPEALKATLERTLPNVAREDTTILVSIDDDDEDTLNVLGSLPSECQYSIKPREDTRGPKCDRALTEAPAGVYLIGHDCAPIITHGFDQLVVDAAWRFPDGIGCVCGPLANASFPVFQAPTARLVELMGYIYHPGFPFWFIDHWLDDIARMIGRYWMVPVELDHVNTRPQKTIGLRDVTFWASYFDLMAGERREQAEDIINAMDEPYWRKLMLRDSWPMIDYRSRWVNDLVRGNAAAIEADRGGEEPTEAYLRAKRAAVDHMVRLAG